MNKTDIQIYQMIARVAEFTTANMGLFPKSSAVAEILAGLHSTVNEMSKQAGAQAASEGTMQESRTARTGARDSLTKRLFLTEQVARALKSDKFPMPTRRRDHDLVSTAHAFIENGASLGKEFSKHALPLNELTASIGALERANLDYSSGKANRASAIREFRLATMEAMGYFDRLEAIVEMTLSDNPTAVASWTVARTVPRAAVRKREVQPPDPAPPPSPVPVPAKPPDSPAPPVPPVVSVVESAAA